MRNATLINQDRINNQPVVIIGVGAIGSHLAEMLAKLGVLRLTLIDFDEIDTVNLGVQGFYEAEVGHAKVEAVEKRLLAINSEVQVESRCAYYAPEFVPSGSAVFSCVDSMKVRRRILRHFRENDWPVLFDGRMAAESLRVFCIERKPESIAEYQNTLFPSHEAWRESCTARATIYCASMAAAILCALYKRWAMNQCPDFHLQYDIFSFDCFR